MTAIEQFDIFKWKEYLREKQVESFYLIPEMREFYDANNNSKSCWVDIYKNEKLLGLALGEITRQKWDFLGISKRTVFYTEPSYNGDLAVLDALLKKIKRKAEGNFIQIRNSKNITAEERALFEKNGFIYIDHLDAKISLKKKNEIWNSFEKDKKRGIRKAIEKYHLEIIEKSDQEGVVIFYSLMKALYNRKRHPFKSRSYFDNLLKSIGKDKVRIFFAYLGATPIATQLAVFHDQVVTALYTATTPSHLDKKAGDFLVWHIINLGIDSGYHTFDFGGGGNPRKKYGPREYKKRFGCSFNNVGRFIYPRRKIYFVINKIYEKVLRG